MDKVIETRTEYLWYAVPVGNRDILDKVNSACLTTGGYLEFSSLKKTLTEIGVYAGTESEAKMHMMAIDAEKFQWLKIKCRLPSLKK